jgi:hypothetical protein
MPRPGILSTALVFPHLLWWTAGLSGLVAHIKRSDIVGSLVSAEVVNLLGFAKV